MTKDKLTIIAIPIICGLTAANMYYIQPLFLMISESLGITYVQSTNLFTAQLIGNVLSLILFIPVADVIDRRKIIGALYLCLCTGLFLVYFSTNFNILLGGYALIGVGASSVPLIIAFYNKEKKHENIIGYIMGGVLLGIIGSRFASGILSNFLGWRGIYIVSFFLMLLGASFVLKNMNPNSENKEKNISYLNVIRSNIMATLEDRSVRLYCFYGFATMFSFTAFWTNIATYLDQSLDFSTTEIALFSLLGVLGALVAIYAPVITGSIFKTSLRLFMTGIALLACAIALPNNLIWLGGFTALFDALIQLIHVSNQKKLYSRSNGKEAQAASNYMTFFMLGGAVGGFTSSIVYTTSSWNGVLTMCLGLFLLMVIIERKKYAEY